MSTNSPPSATAHAARSVPAAIRSGPDDGGNRRAEAGSAPADVVQAQQDIAAAEVVTVIYPLWWLSMPAILKGYVDRVFARGFAYESQNSHVRGLLTGRENVCS